MPARDEVLLRGLIDWVALERIHRRVARGNAGEPIAVIQNKVLAPISSLVADGLLELSDLATDRHRFDASDTSLDESPRRYATCK